jgi:hypothetical protein
MLAQIQFLEEQMVLMQEQLARLREQLVQYTMDQMLAEADAVAAVHPHYFSVAPCMRPLISFQPNPPPSESSPAPSPPQQSQQVSIVSAVPPPNLHPSF